MGDRSLKLFNYACIGFALFLPWGIATHGVNGVRRIADCSLRFW